MKGRKSLNVLALVWLFLLVSAGLAGAETYYVDANGSADFTTVQAAIDDPCVVDGDEIEVAPGTYYEAIDFKGKAITLRSSDPNDANIVSATVIDGTGYYHVVQCVSSEGPDTILAGFTITGGNANGGSWPDYHGGGMLNDGSSPTVMNCIFTWNWATEGSGGMLNNWSYTTVTNCTFSYNNAGTNGGGIYNYESSPTVTNCTFSDNSAQWGGGMYNYGDSSPKVTDCNFSGNITTNAGAGIFNNYANPTVTNCTFSGNWAGINGGGIYNSEGSPTILNCAFSNNSGQYGGGLYNHNSRPSVTNCKFYKNVATTSGGGMFNNISLPTVTGCDFYGNKAISNDGGGMCNQNSSPYVVNCTFRGNIATGNGGGMYDYINCSPTILNCAFSNNSGQFGGGLYNHNSRPSVTNCKFYENVATTSGGGMFNNISSPTVTGCDFYGNKAINNDGGGMCNQYSSPYVVNCTFRGNIATGNGGGMYDYINCWPKVTNCILWGNLPNQMVDFILSSAVVTYSDVQGGWLGGGNIDDYPFFVDAGGGDFRLGTYSPCVDAGNNAAVPPGVTTDLDGNPRFVDDTGVADKGAGTAPIVDMGAYERQVQSESVENVRSQTRLDHFWRFERNFIPDSNQLDPNQAAFDDSGWRIVSVPHDWSIEDLTRENGPFDASAINSHDVGYTVGGTAWYRKTFSLDANDSNKIVHLQFDGVYMNSDVWVNGTHEGNRPYGYSTFWFDIADDVNFGADNVVAVEVKNEGKNSRWYSGSGIFRPVTVTIMDKVHIAHWGPYITTPVVSTSSAEVRVRTKVKNESDTNETLTLQSTILNSNGVAVATDSEIFAISSGTSHEFDQTIAVGNPNLWSIDSPMLYTLSQQVYVSGQIVDHVETTFGIRSISFDVTNGFLLNGENVLLQGGCMHHDNYMLGSACYDRAEERRVEIMKAAGYNAIRTSHNPPSQAFLEACDHLGVLVIDEAFDMWNYRKWDHDDDYSKYFANWWQADINSMVLRDRNHASIIMWSIGNEIPEQWSYDDPNWEAPKTSDMLATYVRSLDPTRPVTLGANCYGEKYDPYLDTLDVVGYNYQLGSYASEHLRVPERVMFVSETHPQDAFDYWKAVEDNSYVLGDFVWTGYDYLGEAGIGWTGYGPWGLAPYPWHLAYCGDIDACGYKRPAAYYRGVLWKTGQNKVCAFVTNPKLSLPDYDPNCWKAWVYPDIHPSWTWPGYEGTNLEVTVYSKCDTVELFLNDVSLGTKATLNANEYTATWDVNYAAGELKVVGYISAVPQAEWILNTAGAAASIQLSADTNTIAADGSDLCYVTAELLDGSGNAVYDPNEDKLISFDVKGPVKLAGVGNANPYGTESFQQPQRTTFRGRCVAVVKSTLRTGTITVTASSSGLTSDSVVIQTTGDVTGNTAPVANDDSYLVYRGETLDVWLYGVTSNDMDAELDPLSVVLVSDVSHGALTLNSDGTFEYDPNDTFIGMDSFTYWADDGDANSNVATVTIDVKIRPPEANDDKYDTGKDTILNVNANSGVLANDIAYKGALTAILVSGVSHGSLTLNPNGSFQYEPNSGFTGMDSFSYKANDGEDSGNVATVSICVGNLVGWWKFDDGSGTTAKNSGDLGSSNDGTLVNMDDSNWVDGRIGGALEFDGIDNYVSIPALNLNSNTVTITAWIKLDGEQNAYSGIVYSRDGNTVAGLRLRRGNYLCYNWSGTWYSGSIVPDSNWVFVALVVEPTQATIYMDEDGELSSSTNITNHDIEEFDGITRIGDGDFNINRHFNGRIDDVRIYNYSLSQERIEELAIPR